MQAALSRRGATATTSTIKAGGIMTASSSPAGRPLAERATSAASASSSPSPGNGGNSGNSGGPRASLLGPGGRNAALAGVVAAAGLFGWLTGGKKDTGDKPAGKYDDVLAAARKPRGCPAASAPPEGLEAIALASGCFWGSQLAMDRVPGVEQTWVGYTQGDDPAPSYDSVCAAWGSKPHTEAVLVWYDKKEADLNAILDEYLANFDPTTRNRQGGDRGPQYRSGIYYTTEEQRAAAERKLAEADAVARAGQGVTRSGRRWEGSGVVVELKPATEF